MKKDNDQTITSRRGFMKCASAGVVATGAMAVGEKVETAAERKPTGGLYRETEHVKRYYELARD
jgi:hypothetical protein